MFLIFKIILRSVTYLLSVILLSFVTTLHPAQWSNAKTEANIDQSLTPQPAKQYITRKEKTLHTLPNEVLKLMKKHRVPEKNVSVYVRDLSADVPLLSHAIDIARSPASTMKLVTTYAALKGLDPNYIWQTQAWIRGELKDGVLNGDLILKGYGDPFLVYENYWMLVHEIRQKGIVTITGDIIIDNTFYDLPKHNPAAFDGQPLRVYNAAPSALMFNFQATRFLIRADKEEKKVVVIPYPWVPGFS